MDQTSLESVTYCDVLKEELRSRLDANSRYSLRAFARDLGFSPGRLSQVLNRKCGLSPTAAEAVARRLQLSPAAKEHFLNSAISLHARCPEQRKRARQRLRRQQGKHEFRQREADELRLVSDWYHLAIVELAETAGFEPDPRWISRRLRISPHQAESALKRLFRLGLLTREAGRVRASSNSFSTKTGVTPSQAIRDFHGQVLELGKLSISGQATENRDLSALIVAVDKAELDHVRRSLKEFRRGFAKERARSPRKNAVYCLAIQFFELTGGDHE